MSAEERMLVEGHRGALPVVCGAEGACPSHRGAFDGVETEQYTVYGILPGYDGGL